MFAGHVVLRHHNGLAPCAIAVPGTVPRKSVREQCPNLCLRMNKHTAMPGPALRGWFKQNTSHLNPSLPNRQCAVLLAYGYWICAGGWLGTGASLYSIGGDPVLENQPGYI